MVPDPGAWSGSNSAQRVLFTSESAHWRAVDAVCRMQARFCARGCQGEAARIESVHILDVSINYSLFFQKKKKNQFNFTGLLSEHIFGE